MKNLAALAASLLLLHGSASAFEARVDRRADGVSASFVSQPQASADAKAPIGGNFFVFRGVFESKDLSCDEFLAKVHALISDWRRYPHANLYSLSWCTRPSGLKSSTELIYGIDAWRTDAVAEVQAFLKDHRGLEFQGQALWFAAVKKLDVKTTLTLGTIAANGGLTTVRSADAWSFVSGTDQWFPANAERARIIGQTDLDVFLDWVGRTYGEGERRASQDALVKSDYVGFGDFFTVHLDNGESADFWLGFGGNRRCGAQPCFSKKPAPRLSRPEGAALRSLLEAASRTSTGGFRPSAP